MFLSSVTFFILIFSNILPASFLNDEGIALLAFKHSIKQDPLGSLDNWNYSDVDPCNWNGVTCKYQKVVSLSIPNNALSGFLSSSLGSLTELRHLNLRSNNFSGFLPSEIFRAKGLQSLVLYENLLSGPLPSEVGDCHYLEALDLSHNLFNGSLPTSLVHCERLRNLDLGHNNLSGQLPDEIGEGLTSLEKLDLSHNGFSGPIPGDLGNLSSLQGNLDLSHNAFDGSIPANLGDLPEKVYIDLAYNNLSGPIPQNGALINRGPTAFIGNVGLCGPPLKKSCDPTRDVANASASFPFFPNNSPPIAGTNVSGRRLSKGSIVAIVVGDVIGICVIGLLFSYCYWRIRLRKKRKNEHAYGYGNGGKSKKESWPSRKDESEMLSRNAEHRDLVPLDGNVAFDIDELLKASAFVLGKSGIGILYKVVLEDGQTLAVRRLGEGGSQRFKEFQNEVEAIGKLRHRNIVNLRAYYWSVDENLLIYDFIPNGNLATAIHGKPGVETFDPLSWPARLKIMKGIAKGLVYLHEYGHKKYVHGNLKPVNVLIGLDMEPRISDFGLARLANITESGSLAIRSNRTVFENQIRTSMALEAPIFASYYQAPEVLKAMRPSQQWDVYSFGVMLLEIITGRPASVQVGSSSMELVKWVELCVDERKPISDVLDPHLAVSGDEREGEIAAVFKIGMACVQSGPETRPLMRHVLDALERVGTNEY